MTGSSIPIAALGELEAEEEEEVVEPVDSDDPEVAVDPDLPVVLVVALTEPVVTVLFLLPEGTITPEVAERGTVTKLEFAAGGATGRTEGVPAGTLATAGWVVTGGGCEVAGVVTGDGWVVTGDGCSVTTPRELAPVRGAGGAEREDCCKQESASERSRAKLRDDIVG